MSKGFTKIGLIIGAAVLLLAGIFLVRSVFASQTPEVDQQCQYTCPVVHFEWSTTVYDNCPHNYSVQNDTTKCRLNYYPYTLINRPSHQINHTADVQYDKSQDPHKCHRPSDNDLKNEYGMDNDARKDFKDANSEWKDSSVVENSCPVPTVTPTPTVEPTVTPTPTDEPKQCGDNQHLNNDNNCTCNEGYHPVVSVSKEVALDEPLVCEPDPEVTPTPTEEPTPTPTPEECQFNCGGGSAPTFAGSSTNAPVCTDGNTVQLPANPHVYRNGESATVNFFITQGDSANVYWRVVGQSDWQNALSDLKPNADHFVSVTIHGLDPKLGYDFGIQQVQGCGGGQLVTAVIVDGPTPTLFKFSYWEWSK